MRWSGVKEDSDRTTEPSVPPATLRVFVLFALFVLQSYIAEGLLDSFGLYEWNGPVVLSGLSALLIVPFLLRLFSPYIFSRPFWRLPRIAWLGVAAIVGMQLTLNKVPLHDDNTITLFRAVSALTAAPLIEETVRAAILFPLRSQWGTLVAVLITALLNASAHSHPLIATVQQLALTMVLVWTEGSIPGNIIAHFVMNVIVVLHHGVAKG